MNSISSFYDELDLKYPEIAICIERIDRSNPGNPKFIIPVLTPNMSIDTGSSQHIRQNTSNLRNGEVIPEITDITMNNYIQIPLPKELFGNYDPKYETLSGVATSRYIKKGSKWIVVFVGGDVTKPRIIAPYEHLLEEG